MAYWFFGYIGCGLIFALWSLVRARSTGECENPAATFLAVLFWPAWLLIVVAAVFTGAAVPPPGDGDGWGSGR